MTSAAMERLSFWALVTTWLLLIGLLGWGGRTGDGFAGPALAFSSVAVIWRRSVLNKRQAAEDRFPAGRIDWPSLLMVIVVFGGPSILVGGWMLTDPLTPMRQASAVIGGVMILGGATLGPEFRRRYIAALRRSGA